MSTSTTAVPTTSPFQTCRPTDLITGLQPIDTPVVGPDFPVDENILLALPVPNSRLISCNYFGSSTFSQTAKLVVTIPNSPRPKVYFLKVNTHANSEGITRTDFETLKTIHGVMPSFCPRPITWGPYSTNSSLTKANLEPKGIKTPTYYLLQTFHSPGISPPSPELFPIRLAQMHRRSMDVHPHPQKYFGSPHPIFYGTLELRCGFWSENWKDVFRSLLEGLLSEDEKANPRWEELEVVKRLTLGEGVLGGLLGRLEDGETIVDAKTGENRKRKIRPAFIHGDLWDGNACERVGDGGEEEDEAELGEPWIFDGAGWWAHHEFEIGNWRAPRHRISRDDRYRERYFEVLPRSDPVEEWDSRNVLYSLIYNASAAVQLPGLKQREVIHEDMLELCQRHCPEDLEKEMAALAPSPYLLAPGS